MCLQCDYSELLERAGLGSTRNRLRVLEVIGNNETPLSAGEIHNTLTPGGTIDRVTVYRILDILVKHDVIERLNTGHRSFHYGLAPNENHRPHPHFFCKKCGQIHCLDPDSLSVDMEIFKKTFPGKIDRIEVRVEGVCSRCLR